MIIGSTAMKYWFPESREPKDLDIISHSGATKDKVEYHWQPSFQYILDHNQHPEYLDPNFLYTLKVSHASWDVRWEKTMVDIIYLKERGCKLDKELYDLLYKDWEIEHFPKRLSLNKKNEEFFQADRKVTHDKLHERFMFYDKPLTLSSLLVSCIQCDSESIWVCVLRLWSFKLRRH